MTLPPLQQLFWQFVRGERVDPLNVARTFTAGRSLSALERLSIYRDMYWARSYESLAEAFPLLHQRLGAAGFAALTRAYLGEYPSEDPRLECLGQHLERFLRDHDDTAWREVADLAGYEWALCEVFLAPDPPEVLERFQARPAVFPYCRFELVPALRLLTLSTDPTASSPTTSDQAFHLAIWRKGFTVSDSRLDADEMAAARAASAGANMAEVCAHFAGSVDGGVRATSVIRSWVARRWIARIIAPLSQEISG